MQLDKANVAIAIAAASALFTGANMLLNVLHFRRTGRRVVVRGDPTVQRTPQGSVIAVRLMNRSSVPEKLIRFELRCTREPTLTLPIQLELPLESETTVLVPGQPILDAWKQGLYVTLQASIQLRFVVAPERAVKKTLTWQQWNRLVNSLAAATT